MSAPSGRLAAALAAAALVAAALVAPAAQAQAPTPAPAPAPIAITGATVYVRADRKVDGATVVIRDGRIADVGVGVAVPGGAQVIDGRGKVVTAGLIEASSQLGLVEIDLEPSASDGQFGAAPDDVHAAFRAADAYNARAVNVAVARAGGVTASITGPLGGLVAGQAALVSLGQGAGPLGPPAAMHAALGRGGVASGSRGQAAERLRELLADADAFRRDRAAYDRNQSRRLVGGRLDLEALVPVLEARMPLVIGASAEVEIRTALAIAAERRLRIAIRGGAEAWRVARELAAAKVPVLLDPSANLPGNLGALEVRDDAAAVLARAGVPLVISTLGEATQVRTLRQLAGIAVGAGLPWSQALAAITSAPAEAFGIAGRGTLERGAIADVVVWTGDPLEVTTLPAAVIIGGAIQPLQTHQSRLLERYRALPRR